MDYVKAMDAIEKGDVHPVYLMWGKKSLIREVVSAIRSRVVDPLWSEVNCFKMDGAVTTVAEAVTVACSAPFGSGGRLVVVDNPRWGSGAALKEVLSLARGPKTGSTLVFTHEEKPDGSTVKELLAELDKRGGLVDCSNRAVSATDWVRYRTGKMGLQIAEDALWALVQTSGGDLDMLDTEIEKLAAYCRPETLIRLEDVHAVAWGTSELKAFQVADLALAGRAGEAMRLYEGGSGSELAQLSQAFQWTLRSTYRFKHFLTAGCAPNEAARKAGIKPFLVRKFGELARRLDGEQIASLMEAIVDAESSVRSGRMDERTAAVILLFEVARVVNAGPAR